MPGLWLAARHFPQRLICERQVNRHTLPRASRTEIGSAAKRNAARAMQSAPMCVAAVIAVALLAAVSLASLSKGARAADFAAQPPTTKPVPEPDGYRTHDYRTPVPKTLRGAKVLSDGEAFKIWSGKSAIFIDVYPHPPKPAGLPPDALWRETMHFSIENAVWLPNVGYGVLSPKADAYFKRNLTKLTDGDKDKELVFFCLRNCWMSWNAAKRALSYGYTHVDWYPDGSDGWQEFGGFVEKVKPLP
jgi:PQQ-dependent catabolism-associated CXXCW motif protein